MSDVPKITYYARAIDNITGQSLSNWSDATKNSLWYFGKCNGFTGGESEYTIEIDIWNNEPAFNAGMYNFTNNDAINCKFTAEENATTNSPELFKLVNPVVHARQINNGYKEKFKPIKDTLMLEDITGNANPNLKGVIQGCSDHAMLQVKIVLPEGINLQDRLRYGFNLVFYYEYE